MPDTIERDVSRVLASIIEQGAWEGASALLQRGAAAGACGALAGALGPADALIARDGAASSWAALTRDWAGLPEFEGGDAGARAPLRLGADVRVVRSGGVDEAGAPPLGAAELGSRRLSALDRSCC